MTFNSGMWRTSDVQPLSLCSCSYATLIAEFQKHADKCVAFYLKGETNDHNS
jgi:hypothetical protein